MSLFLFRRRRLPIVLLVVAGAVGSLLIAPVRTAILRGLGHALVAEDPLGSSDVIAIAPDVGDAGVLEAADLVRLGISDRVLVLADPRTALHQELERRGVSYRDEGQQMIRTLRDLGATRVELLRLQSGGTEDAARLLSDWAARQRVRTATLVTSSDHSRRARRAFTRAARATGLRIRVRIARFSAFAPQRWWQSRGGLRTGIVELQKLALDLLAHPLS